MRQEFGSLLPEDQKQLLATLVEVYHDVYALEDGESGETGLVKLRQGMPHP